MCLMTSGHSILQLPSLRCSFLGLCLCLPTLQTETKWLQLLFFWESGGTS